MTSFSEITLKTDLQALRSLITDYNQPNFIKFEILLNKTSTDIRREARVKYIQEGRVDIKE